MRLTRFLFFPLLGYDRRQLQRRLAGKRVLITGASYGIGEKLAELLASTSAHLLLVARTEAKLQVVQQRIIDRGGKADILPCDLRDPEAVRSLLTALHQYPDGIDVVVSNAGKSICRSIFDSLDRLHDFTRTINLNYLGPVQLLLSLIPLLVERQGQIINISAVNVRLVPVPKWAAYQASKTAFDQWFRCVGPELNACGVSTTSIYLPLVRTRMMEPTVAYKKVPALQPEQVAQLICHAMITRQRIYAPWWLMIGQLASVLGRGIWESVAVIWLKRQQ